MESTTIYSSAIDTPQKREWFGGLHILVIVAFISDLLTPILIWKHLLPAEVRWISYVAIAIMICLCLARMIVFDRIPRAFWLIIGMSFTWVFVARAQGQGISATLWGWWLFFQFPLVGLFVYLATNRSPKTAEFIRIACLVVLVVEVLAQLFQVATGESLGDNLSGTLGKTASQQLALFTILENAVFLGHWIATKRWQGLIFSIGLSTVSNVLAENKLYIVAIALLGLMSIILFFGRHGSFFQVMKYIVLVLASFLCFNYLYDSLIPSASRVSLLDYITEPRRLDNYLNYTDRTVKYGSTYTYMGRNYALSVGWESLQRDPLTFLFGYGIGSRSESRTLGTSGIGFGTSFEGLSVGTTLLVFMQELGVVGLILIEGFFIWLIMVLSRHIKRSPLSPATGLRYGIILFTIFWPIWVWYIGAWTIRVFMLPYWAMVGYVLAEAWQEKYVTGYRKKLTGLSIDE